MAESSHKILVGMGGWDLPPFSGPFYPANPAKGFRKLSYYAGFFDCVEINVTFYNLSLAPGQVRRWLDDVSGNPGFEFTAKLFRGFTHTFDASTEDAVRFQRLLAPLRDAGKLSGVILQFPSSFARTPERLDYLGMLASTFGEDPLFLELRHRSWSGEDVESFAKDHEMCLVSSDLPAVGAHPPLRPIAMNGRAYLRLMGRNAETWNHPEKGDRYEYRYSEDELKGLAEQARTMAPAKTFVVFHNDPQANSPVNGFQMRHLLNPKKPLVIPPLLLARFPELRLIGAAPPPDEPLFSSPDR